MEQAAPHGPPDLRRRGLRQDRGGPAGGLQGGHGRQAGGRPGADHRPGPAALPDLHRAAQALSRRGRDALPLSHAQAAGRGRRRPGPGRRGHCHRHPSPAVRRRRLQGPGPADHRRGAALWRDAQGAAQADAPGGGRADPDRHAHPPHAAHVADRRARHEHHRHAARGAAAGAHPRRRVRRDADPPGHPARDWTGAARSISSTTG